MSTQAISDNPVSDAYLYLLGRLLVLRSVPKITGRYYTVRIRYSLTFRFYRPKGAVEKRTYFHQLLDGQRH